MNKISAIYKITSPTGKIYIGQTKDVHGRIWKYKNYHCKNQIKLHNSLIKHGWDNHKFEILKECPIELLNELEIKYIKDFNSTDRELGLNLKEGGNSGGKLSEEIKEKIRVKAIGRKASLETKQLMSKNRKGKPKSTFHKNKLAQNNRERLSKKIIGIIGGTIHHFESRTAAAKQFNVSRSLIDYSLENNKKDNKLGIEWIDCK